MNTEEEICVHINEDAGFSVMYDLETGVDLDPDADLHFIRLVRCPEVWYQLWGWVCVFGVSKMSLSTL